MVVAIFLAWQTVTEFKPSEEQVISINNNSGNLEDTLCIVSWNIGYFGLGAEMDFFYEGGKDVRPSKELYLRYSDEGVKRVESFNTADFILLQEVDTLSRRSYNDNQFNRLMQVLPGFHSYYASNYDAWVPVPVQQPMGRVKAGMASFTRNEATSVRRVSFGSSYAWPMRLFQLKRCFLEMRFNTSTGKQLVLINTHNSAFADADVLREKELAMLKSIMIDEFGKGNYVIIGGDWNQNPPAYTTETVLNQYNASVITPAIPKDYLPEGWHYVYDSLHTTNRYVSTPYTVGQTESTIIDFFVVSPNIKVLTIETIPTDYRESDHQPISMKFQMMNRIVSDK